MLIKEYRVTLPLTVDEYQVAQLYSVAEASKTNTGGGEGVEVLKNEPFDDHPLLGGKYSKGQYTYKIYHLARCHLTSPPPTRAQSELHSALSLGSALFLCVSKVPAFIRLLAPKGSLEVHEEAWNAYPYCRTVITNPTYMKENMVIMIESMHIADTGHQQNVHELPPEKLKMREVVHIDIANDPVQSADYKPDEDPTKFKSQKTGRGPLVGQWQDKVNPVMTCYKLVTVEFKWFGLQNRIESFIQKSERRLFNNFHRQVFCWMDRWHGLTMDDIRAIEDKTKEELDKQRNVGEVRGMRAESD